MRPVWVLLRVHRVFITEMSGGMYSYVCKHNNTKGNKEKPRGKNVQRQKM